MRPTPARLPDFLRPWAVLLIGTLSLGQTSMPTKAPRPVQFGPNVMLDGTPTFEPAITVNSLNPNSLVVGFFKLKGSGGASCLSYFSADGGLTWNQGGAPPQPSTNNSCIYVSLSSDSQGNFYYAYSINPQSLMVAKSTDGGRSFPTASTVATFEEFPYVEVDSQPASHFQGSIYVTYSDLSTGDIKLVRSRDGGSTWSTPLTLAVETASSPFIDGSRTVVAPDGTAYVFYLEFDVRTFGAASVLFVSSSDGGVTWSQPVAVASHLPTLGFFNLRNADPSFGSKPDRGFEASSLPTAAIGPDGTIFVAWADLPHGSCTLLAGDGEDPCTNTDIRLSVSRDRGKSWTAPVKVSGETSATDQFNPSITVRDDGLVSLIWLDKRLDPNNVNFDAFYTNTYDGVNFLPDVRVSSATSLVGNSGLVGNYIGIDGNATQVFPIWDDMRNGKSAIVTASGTLSP
jgi:hypothetical protein